jgi:hypothetical protein
LTIFKVNFIRDVENCIFAKVKYHADVNSWQFIMGKTSERK